MVEQIMIDTLLDACQFVLENQGEPQSCYWLASQVVEMKLWRASEAGVRRALNKDIAEHGESSRFVLVANDKFALRSWTEQIKQPAHAPLASIEADLFGALFGFHKKTMRLLRQVPLDAKKLKVVAERIKTLLDEAKAEMERTRQLNMTERLEAAYREIERLVAELSGVSDDRKRG
jgi:hypothetical protein